MDGATKFVKGDAIAGVVITLINIIGGLIIGCLTMGMDAVEALKTYTTLTIGDGLVSQIPALLISTGTGILVTRSSSGNNFGKDFSQQLISFPKVMFIAGCVLLVLGLVPALPNILFISLSIGVFSLYYVLYKSENKKEMELQEAQTKAGAEEQRQPENILNLFKVDPLEIEIGYGLISLTDKNQGGDLLERLATVRRQCASEQGVYVRPIRIRDNLQLEPNKYVFKIKGVQLAEGEVLPKYYLAMNPDNSDSQLEGIPTKEPTFGMPAVWIKPSQKIQAETMGFTVVDAITVMITHLTEFIKAHAYELLGRQDVKELIDMVKENDPAVIEDLIPDALSLGEVQRVLQYLLRERIPIKDMVTILEALSDGARNSRDIDYLVECARGSLSRSICNLFLGLDGKLHIITMDPKLEQKIAESIQPIQEGGYPVLDPGLAQSIIDQLNNLLEKCSLQGITPVCVCSGRIRLPFRRFIERYLPHLNIMSINEIASNIEISSAGMVMMFESKKISGA
jgi:flagellar biosynthesis protein FlhA